MSDSTFSGKQLTMPPGKFEEMEQHMENAALDEVRQEGYQAGLKRGAALAMDQFDRLAITVTEEYASGYKHAQEDIEQAILREVSGG